MKSKTVAFFCVVAVLVVLAFALNPSAERHRQKIREAVAERSTLQRLLGVGLLTAFASNYHSIGVGSYTMLNGQPLSIGAFGMIVVVQ